MNSLKIEEIKSGADEADNLTALLYPSSPYIFRNSINSLRESGAADLNDSFGENNEWIERPVQLNGRPFLLRLADDGGEADAPRLRLSIQSDDNAETPPLLTDLEAAAEWANRRFWLALDMQAVREALIVNEYGEELAAKYWPARPAQLPSAWEGLLKTVMSVQIYPGLATRLQQALRDVYGEKASFGGKEYHFYPSPEKLVNITPDELLALRFSRQKARYLPGIAQAITDKPEKFNWERLRQLPAEQAVAILDDLPGVGTWTAHYIAMRGLPHLDVFVDEESLRKALSASYNRRTLLSQPEASRLMQVFSPYRSFACYYTYMKMYSA